MTPPCLRGEAFLPDSQIRHAQTATDGLAESWPVESSRGIVPGCCIPETGALNSGTGSFATAHPSCKSRLKFIPSPPAARLSGRISEKSLKLKGGLAGGLAGCTDPAAWHPFCRLTVLCSTGHHGRRKIHNFDCTSSRSPGSLQFLSWRIPKFGVLHGIYRRTVNEQCLRIRQPSPVASPRAVSGRGVG